MLKLLTRSDAALRLGVSVVTVDRLRKAGKLGYIQYAQNGKVWITEDAIAEYIARSTHPARPQKETAWTYRKRRK